jgi:hypothetical protein
MRLQTVWAQSGEAGGLVAAARRAVRLSRGVAAAQGQQVFQVTSGRVACFTRRGCTGRIRRDKSFASRSLKSERDGELLSRLNFAPCYLLIFWGLRCVGDSAHAAETHLVLWQNKTALLRFECRVCRGPYKQENREIVGR